MVKVDHEAQVGVRKDTPVNTNTESCRITLAEEQIHLDFWKDANNWKLELVKLTSFLSDFGVFS